MRYRKKKALTWTCNMIAGHINAFSWIVECPFKFNVCWICINATSDLSLLLLCDTINTWLIWAAWWRICSKIIHQISLLKRFLPENDWIKHENYMMCVHLNERIFIYLVIFFNNNLRVICFFTDKKKNTMIILFLTKQGSEKGRYKQFPTISEWHRPPFISFFFFN